MAVHHTIDGWSRDRLVEALRWWRADDAANGAKAVGIEVGVSYPACGSASILNSHLAPLGPSARKIAIFADNVCGLLN